MNRFFALCFTFCLFCVFSVVTLLVCGYLGILRAAYSQTIGDGIPDPVPGQHTPTNVCYTDESGRVVSESFEAPVVTDDFGLVVPLFFSPVDAQRLLQNLPNFGLAKFHWWVVSQALFRAQRQYADCVAGIRENQIIRGMQILIDSPGSLYLGQINAVREYQVPFEAIQNSNPSLPPTLADAIRHVNAALYSEVITVLNVQACRQSLESERAATRRFLGR